MLDLPLLLILAVLAALVFDYTNGAHDTGNAIATIVSTKVLSPVQAVVMAATLNFVGAFLGTEVASTIGGSIVHLHTVRGAQLLILASVLGAIIWNALTWYLGLPSSSSHALIGGLVGAAVVHAGWSSLNYTSILSKVIMPLAASPLAGFIGGYLFMVGLAWMCVRARPAKVNKYFRRLQVLSSAFMATSHGTNDAQKTMGIITLLLFVFHRVDTMEVPIWVRVACSLAMLLGTLTGGWKIIKTMGHKVFKIEPIHGFAAETSAALVIITASFFGAPISTTHTISSSVIGVGASKRLSAVRWGVAGNMVVAWVLTIPAAAAAGAISYTLLRLIF